jgi:hypothetical protein
MEKARRDGLPLKVQAHNEYAFGKMVLNPELPAKKRLPCFDGAKPMKLGLEQNIQKVKPSLPVKKRVNAWLLEEPFPRLAEDSLTSRAMTPR